MDGEQICTIIVLCFCSFLIFIHLRERIQREQRANEMLRNKIDELKNDKEKIPLRLFEQQDEIHNLLKQVDELNKKYAEETSALKRKLSLQERVVTKKQLFDQQRLCNISLEKIPPRFFGKDNDEIIITSYDKKGGIILTEKAKKEKPFILWD